MNRDFHANRGAKFQAKDLSLPDTFEECLQLDCGLKTASGRRPVHDKSLKEVSALLGVTDSWLYAACNTAGNGTHFRAALLATLTVVTGSDFTMRFLARASNFRLVPDAFEIPADPTKVDIDIATNSMRQCADAQVAFADAISDSVVTDEECARFEREADEAITAILASKSHLRLRSGAGAR